MEKPERLAAVVVVYNTRCEDSITCQALKTVSKQNISVTIYDNSTEDYGNRVYCEEKGWQYLGGEGNIGLSKAYNACIDALIGKIDWICLFDDDTVITGDYFSMLRDAIQGGDDLYAPLIFSNQRILSPCRIREDFRAILFPDEETVLSYTGKDLTAINTGMAISMRIFQDYRYDERIFLDGIDHVFVRDMAKRGIYVHPFPYTCEQNFSADEKSSEESAKKRFSIFCKDMKYVLKEDSKNYRRLILRRALRLTMQYKTRAFLQIFRRAECGVRD